MAVLEDRFVWASLGLALLALLLVVVALAMGAVSLRRSRTALAQGAAARVAVEAARAPIPEPAPEPSPEPEPQAPAPASAVESGPEVAPAPNGEDVRDRTCQCGHSRSVHAELGPGGGSMCLADVTPACQCRQFTTLQDDTVRILV